MYVYIYILQDISHIIYGTPPRPTFSTIYTYTLGAHAQLWPTPDPEKIEIYLAAPRKGSSWGCYIYIHIYIYL